jgi:hypothetical protein
MSATTSAPKVNPVAMNLAQRQAFIANSKQIRKTLATVSVVPGQSNYAIPLNNQGALIAVDLLVTLNLTNDSSTAAADPQVGAPYSFFSNINFVDQGNVTRHNLSGRFLYDYMALRSMRAAPYGSAVSLAEGGAEIPPISYPGVPSLAASGTGTVTFMLHVPIAKGWNNTAGMIELQTGNQNQPANLNLTLTNKLNGTPDSPYSQKVTITGGTIVPQQLYYQPLTGTVAPQIDTSVQWALTQSQPDTTNVLTGVQKQVDFQTQFLTSCVGIRYFNGDGYDVDTSISSVLLQANGGTFNMDDSTPLARFLRYRNSPGFDCAPGLFWFDFQNSPLITQAVGVFSATFDIVTANTGAYMEYFYDWLKVGNQYLSLPGISQIA